MKEELGMHVGLDYMVGKFAAHNKLQMERD